MQHIHTRQRPKRDLVQLDHAIVFKDWRNIIHNVHTLTGASNYKMVKVELLVKANESKRSTRLSTHPTDSAFGKIISEMMLTENHDTDNSQPPHSLPQPPQPHNTWAARNTAATTALQENIPTEVSIPKHPWI